MSVAGLERMTTGSVAKRLILSRHTGRQIVAIIMRDNQYNVVKIMLQNTTTQHSDQR